MGSHRLALRHRLLKEASKAQLEAAATEDKEAGEEWQILGNRLQLKQFADFLALWDHAGTNLYVFR